MQTPEAISFDTFKVLQQTNDRITLQFPDGMSTLTLAQGDVTQQHGVDVEAVMNAANEVLYWGGGGTNRAFSSIISQTDWEQARTKTHLEVSDCAEMKWPENP